MTKNIYIFFFKYVESSTVNRIKDATSVHIPVKIIRTK